MLVGTLFFTGLSCLVIFIYCWSRFERQGKAIEELKRKIDKFENEPNSQRLIAQEALKDTESQVHINRPKQAGSIAATQSPAMSTDLPKYKVEPPAQANRTTQVNTARQNFYESQNQQTSPAWLWLRENWTGFIGVAAVVLGIAFAASYVGFVATALTRSIMIALLGGLFIAGSIYLRPKSQWQDLGAWLQAGGGAIILVAFLGGSYFEGLKFYASTSTEMVMLVIGLSLNMALAFYKPRETLSAAHVVMSLLALSVAPSSMAIQWIGTIVCLLGVALSHTNRWSINMALCVAMYTVFNFLQWSGSSIPNWQGLLTTYLVFIPALLVHYRQLYQDVKADTAAGVHLLAWGLFGINLFLYQQTISWLYLPLGLSAMAAFALSWLAKRKGNDWLSSVDFLVSEVLLALTLISLYRVGFDTSHILWLIAVFTLLFMVTASEALMGVTILAASIGGIVYLLFCLALKSNLAVSFPLALLVIYYGCYALLTQYKSPKLNQNTTQQLHYFFNVFMFLLGLIITQIATNWHVVSWLTAGILVGLTFNNKLFYGIHKLSALWFMATFACLNLLDAVPLIQSVGYWQTFSQLGLPLIIMVGFIYRGHLLKMGPSNHWIVVPVSYGVAAFIAIWVFLLEIVDPMLPPLVFLGLSCATLLGPHLLKQNDDKSHHCLHAFHHVGLGFLGLYLIGYLTMCLPSEALLFDYFRIRVLMAIAGVGVSLLWLTHNPRLKVQLALSQSLGFDVIMILILSLIGVELSASMLSLGFISLGIIALILPGPSRKLYYSIGLFAATLIYVPLVSSTWEYSSAAWYEDIRFTGMIALMLAAVWATLFCRGQPTKEATDAASAVYDIQRFDRPLISFVATFFSLALFLMLHFDGAILTTLWVAEVFAMIVLGMMYRSHSIISAAYAFLFICLVRLLLHDFAQSNLLIKSIVFVSVGLLMIAMHITYKKLKGRLENKGNTTREDT